MEKLQSTEFMSENETWSCQSKDNNNNSGDTEQENETLNVIAENCNNNIESATLLQKRRKSSFVWNYFRATANKKSLECIICSSCVSNQTSNLARHLLASHNISRVPQGSKESLDTGRKRTTRSYIWKYCTKENARHARCNLCNKLLYFGSGSTSNISKHLDRLHSHIVGSVKKQNRIVYTMDDEEELKNEISEHKKRKGGSYVWKYCEKLSRHTVQCKLCLKIMSFHGTANVITHLQRKHNVLGKNPIAPAADGNYVNDYNNNANDNNEMLVNATTGLVESTREHVIEKRGQKHPGPATSLVWKYCKRVGPDVVRCSICNKNLSNQGTSNLQRHLHRMHGIVMPGREIQINYDKSYNNEVNDDFLWRHCKLDDNDNYRCNMCTIIFPNNKKDDMIKHLLITHAIKIKVKTSNYKKVRRYAKKTLYTETESSEDDDDDDDDDDDCADETLNKSITNTNKIEDNVQILNYDELIIKKDYEDYDDMLIENTDTEDRAFVAEDPVDAETLPQLNPLSAHSSRDASPQNHGKREYQNLYDRDRMQNLNEERLRMETEYYREKAGFYRMQKYLTALQAKKIRAELEQIYKTHTNNVVLVDDGKPIGTNLTYNLGAQSKIV